MTGVRRGDRVTFEHEGQRVHGLVLDRSDETATWWVAPDGANVAVKVRARRMELAATR